MNPKIRVLNLYAGLGGNRASWTGVDVTAIEIEPMVARFYADRFPNDTVIVGDAHEFLLKNYDKFDFIWSSPPCPTHGQYRHNVGVKAKGYAAVYPDMQLYEEILLLKHHCENYWVVENTIPYYEPLVPAQKVARHLFWANFKIEDIDLPAADIRSLNKISDWETKLGIDLSPYKMKDKRQKLRNCVDSRLGKHVFNEMIKENNDG